MAAKTSSHIKTLEQALAARYGWQTGASWRDELIAAVREKAARLGLDHAAYCATATHSPGELEGLAELLGNGETRFFRDAEQFEALRSKTLPALMRARAGERRLDIWSAACATGEEAYSIAMVLQDLLPAGEKWKVNILATDLRSSAIIAASRGRYPASALGLLDADLRRRCFVEADAPGREPSFDVAPAIRQMVTFRRANIYDANFWKMLRQPFDLIVCNNLLLYFHALASKVTVERFAERLAAGGYLLVMENESSYIDHPRLKRDESLAGAFFRKV